MPYTGEGSYKIRCINNDGDYENYNRFSEIPEEYSNNTRIINWFMMGIPSYFIEEYTDEELDKVNIVRLSDHSITINDVTVRLFLRLRYYKMHTLCLQRVSFMVFVDPASPYNNDVWTAPFSTDIIKRELIPNVVELSSLLLDSVYNYNSEGTTTIDNMPIRPDGYYDGQFYISNESRFGNPSVNISNLKDYMNSCVEAVLNFSMQNPINLIVTNQYPTRSFLGYIIHDICDNISLAVPAITNKYTNNTWSTKKTFYIKVMISKESGSYTLLNTGNVVNYET